MTDGPTPQLELDGLQSHLANELLVPTGRKVDPGELGGFVVKAFERAANEGPEGLTKELVAEAYRFLPLSIEETTAIAKQFGQGDITEDSLNQVDQETESQIDTALEKVAHLPVQRLLLPAADQLSDDAHSGTFRKNKQADGSRQPYRMHVIRVAAMGLYIAETVEADLGIEHDRDFTEANLILDLHHDAVENTSPIGKHYDPNRKGNFSPLLIFKLMERFKHPYSREVAEGLMVITHFKTMPWMHGYDDYIDKRVMTNLFAVMTKQKDIFDNRHNDPKVVINLAELDKINKKHEEYDRTQPKLVKRAPELAPDAQKERIRKSNAALAGMEAGPQTEKVKD